MTFARLAEQVADILASKGSAAWQRAKTSVDDAVSEAQDKGHEAVDAVREVSDNFVEAVDEVDQDAALHDAGDRRRAGFLFGAAWRR